MNNVKSKSHSKHHRICVAIVQGMWTTQCVVPCRLLGVSRRWQGLSCILDGFVQVTQIRAGLAHHVACVARKKVDAKRSHEFHDGLQREWMLSSHGKSGSKRYGKNTQGLCQKRCTPSWNRSNRNRNDDIVQSLIWWTDATVGIVNGKYLWERWWTVSAVYDNKAWLSLVKEYRLYWRHTKGKSSSGNFRVRNSLELRVSHCVCLEKLRNSSMNR